MNRVSINKSGLAWPEVLLVIALVLMLASIAVPALLEVRKNQKSASAFSEMKILISASDRLNKEYRIWPSFDAPPRGDVRYGLSRPNAAVLNILQAVDGLGNKHHVANPSRINFIAQVSAPATSINLNDRGEMVDPWGMPYQIVYDANYDNVCVIEDSSYGHVIGQGMVIWSMGPDKKSDTSDDLLSWKR